MSAEIVQLRDFKRREEREAADVRLAKQVMGLIPPEAFEFLEPGEIKKYTAGNYAAALRSQSIEEYRDFLAEVGCPSEKIGSEVKKMVELLDTAPCEMPPVQPVYTAPEKDPA